VKADRAAKDNPADAVRRPAHNENAYPYGILLRRRNNFFWQIAPDG
jgi:hypothetical protein